MFEKDVNTLLECDKSTSLEIYTKSLLMFFQIEIITVYAAEGSNIFQDSYIPGAIVFHLVLNIFLQFLFN